ncbi:uncharacterized protein [Epargyreus clarus]|uniref:uncharacterized protein n=1 Tax=Epargyreus clarus TaxID=520877 RepID=UPI003C2DC1DD
MNDPVKLNDGVPETGGVDVVPETGVERVEAVESRSESAMSFEGSEVEGRFWTRKRNRAATGEVSDEDDGVNSEPAKAPKVSVARRGRGRPPTTGQYVGLAKAKAELVAAERAEMQLRAEKEVEEAARKVRIARGMKTPPANANDAVEKALATELQDRVRASVEVISKVASKSRNLKGTSVKALRDAAAAISEAIDALQRRTETEEVTRLRLVNDRYKADNDQLRTELAELRREMAELRVDIRRSNARVVEDPTSVAEKAPPTVAATASDPLAEIERTIMLRVGTMVNARFEALQQRLPPEPRVRPPLAADRAKDAKQPESPAAPTSQVVPSNSPVLKSQRGKKGKTVQTPPQKEPRPLPPAPAAMDEGWNVVTRRRSKPAQPSAAQLQPQGAQSATPGSQRPQNKEGRRQTRKLRPPRSSAVAIKLQPEALKKGVTYAAALSEAKEKIDLKGLGIESVKFKVSATGARILEIPGASSSDKADTLADKLRAALGEDAVVSRPVKCAELRVSGLDDAVSAAEVAAAIAGIGGCALASVKTGEIRRNHSGLGTLWLSCPVSAARKVADGGRVLIGWVSAKVSLLEARPLRCYRCLVIGHVREQCSSTVDRSGDCYRCGKSGHIARDCTAVAAHCTACAAAKKPADHRLGGKSCTAPRLKGRKPPTVPSTQSVSGSSAGGSGNGVVAMES